MQEKKINFSKTQKCTSTLNCAPELFQKLNTKYFGDLPGTFIYFDDILIYGQNKEEHDANLANVMGKAKQYNIKFNPNKLQFCLTEVKYLGYIFSKNRLQIDPERIQAIEAMEEPTDKTSLQRFLGFINYVYKKLHTQYVGINSAFERLAQKGK